MKKNLPLQVGETLKNLLEQAKSDSDKVKNLLSQIESYQKQISIKDEMITQYSKNDDRNSNLDRREKDVSEKERNLKIQMLEFQLQVEKDKTDFAKSVALGLVRNTEYKRSLYDNINDGSYTNGNYYPLNRTQNSEETKTAI